MLKFSVSKRIKIGFFKFLNFSILDIIFFLNSSISYLLHISCANSIPYSFLKIKIIPVTIFISTCQIYDKKILDAYYLAALCLESQYKSIKIKNYNFSLQTFAQKVDAYKKL